MSFLRPLFLTIFIAAFSLGAQDSGPVKVDLEGYIDDRKGEVIKSAEPVKEEPKKEVKKEEPKKETAGTRRRPVSTNNTSPSKNTPSNTETRKPVQKVSLDNFSTKSNDSSMMLYIIIGGVVVVAGIVVAVIIMKKKKSPVSKRRVPVNKTNVSLGEKISAHEQAVAAETTEDAQPVMHSASQTQVETAAQDMADQFAKETALNEYGQNASGLIIDEDKYFAGGPSFVDEDFSDLDGPHDAAVPHNPDSPSLPPGS